MTTEIGKELRKLRIDRDERLQDMSHRLEKSSAFISAVERGSKSLPSGFEELVIAATSSRAMQPTPCAGAQTGRGRHSQ